MFNAPSFVRIGLLSYALAALLVPAATAQTVDLGLNITYDDPGDIDSGGIWEVVAKTSSAGGIASLSLRLTGIDATVEYEAPFGRVDGEPRAGFSIQSNFVQNGHRNVILAQVPVPPGEDQGVFYGVGTISNGTPNDLTPAPGSFSNLQNVPWAPEPDPPGDPFGDDPAWDTAATFASGTFSEGADPDFFAGTTGQVFTSVGTSTMSGNIALATIMTFVRSNSLVTELPGDYNEDGKVDAADYVIWRLNNTTNNTLPNDNGLGTPIGTAHYNLWVDNFGAMAGSGGGSGAGAVAVPEPGTALLAALGIGLFAARRSRQAGHTNRAAPSSQRARSAAIVFCAKSINSQLA